MISVLPKPNFSFDDSISSVSTISDEPAPIRILTRYLLQYILSEISKSIFKLLAFTWYFFLILFLEICGENFDKTKIFEDRMILTQLWNDWPICCDLISSTSFTLPRGKTTIKINKSREGVVWWRTRDTGATCHNRGGCYQNGSFSKISLIF